MVKQLQNLHTHTTFCDGKSTAEEMVRAALAAGLTAIGFTGHSYVEGDSGTMSPERTAAYRAEVLRLREAYAGEIAVYLGVEQDSFSLPAAERERLRQAAARLGRELAERWEACPHAARLWMG